MPLLTNAVSRMEEMQVIQTTMALHWSFAGQGEGGGQGSKRKLLRLTKKKRETLKIKKSSFSNINFVSN